MNRTQTTNLSPDKQREMLRQMLSDPPLRGTRLRRLRRRQDLRRRALYRRGGGRGRRVHRAWAGRPDHLDASRPRPLHRQGADLNRMMAELTGGKPAT
jgi:hypothetical protein